MLSRFVSPEATVEGTKPNTEAFIGQAVSPGQWVARLLSVGPVGCRPPAIRSSCLSHEGRRRGSVQELPQSSAPFATTHRESITFRCPIGSADRELADPRSACTACGMHRAVAKYVR